MTQVENPINKDILLDDCFEQISQALNQLNDQSINTYQSYLTLMYQFNNSSINKVSQPKVQQLIEQKLQIDNQLINQLANTYTNAQPLQNLKRNNNLKLQENIKLVISYISYVYAKADYYSQRYAESNFFFYNWYINYFDQIQNFTTQTLKSNYRNLMQTNQLVTDVVSSVATDNNQKNANKFSVAIDKLEQNNQSHLQSQLDLIQNLHDNLATSAVTDDNINVNTSFKKIASSAQNDAISEYDRVKQIQNASKQALANTSQESNEKILTQKEVSDIIDNLVSSKLQKDLSGNQLNLISQKQQKPQLPLQNQSLNQITKQKLEGSLPQMVGLPNQKAQQQLKPINQIVGLPKTVKPLTPVSQMVGLPKTAQPLMPVNQMVGLPVQNAQPPSQTPVNQMIGFSTSPQHIQNRQQQVYQPINQLVGLQQTPANKQSTQDLSKQPQTSMEDNLLPQLTEPNSQQSLVASSNLPTTFDLVVDNQQPINRPSVNQSDTYQTPNNDQSTPIVNLALSTTADDQNSNRLRLPNNQQSESLVDTTLNSLPGTQVLSNQSISQEPIINITPNDLSKSIQNPQQSFVSQTQDNQPQDYSDQPAVTNQLSSQPIDNQVETRQSVDQQPPINQVLSNVSNSEQKSIDQSFSDQTIDNQLSSNQNQPIASQTDSQPTEQISIDNNEQQKPSVNQVNNEQFTVNNTIDKQSVPSSENQQLLNNQSNQQFDAINNTTSKQPVSSDVNQQPQNVEDDKYFNAINLDVNTTAAARPQNVINSSIKTQPTQLQQNKTGGGTKGSRGRPSKKLNDITNHISTVKQNTIRGRGRPPKQKDIKQQKDGFNQKPQRGRPKKIQIM